MNWYKKAITETTMPYFQELAEEGEYVPNTAILKSEVQEHVGYDVDVEQDLGCESNGCAYRLSNGDVLKITTNTKEAKLAIAIMYNPNPVIAVVKDIWRHGDLFCIITEFVNDINNNQVQEIFNWLEQKTEHLQCYQPQCTIDVINKLPDFPFRDDLVSFLQYLINNNLTPYDLLNSTNVGLSNGHLKFFDVT
jgi:hypothetical protein